MDERHHPTKRILVLQSHRARNQICQWQVSAIYKYILVCHFKILLDLTDQNGFNLLYMYVLSFNFFYRQGPSSLHNSWIMKLSKDPRDVQQGYMQMYLKYNMTETRRELQKKENIIPWDLSRWLFSLCLFWITNESIEGRSIFQWQKFFPWDCLKETSTKFYWKIDSYHDL